MTKPAAVAPRAANENLGLFLTVSFLARHAAIYIGGASVLFGLYAFRLN